jgi:hypothetical protein
MNTYEEHIQDSAIDNSRWDGFDRGDIDHDDTPACGMKVIGRMTSGGGYRVSIVQLWHESFDDSFEVYVNNNRVHFTEDRANAIAVARWWMDGCPV